MINKIGYACINMTLGKSATTNRGMTQKTLLSKGTDYVSELALKNCQDIIKILEWNLAHGIKMFRLSSCLIPWGNVVDIDELKDIDQIKSTLKAAGDFAHKHDIRITTHPGPFTVIASPNKAVVENAFKDLEMHSKVFDMMGLSKTPYNKINIHVNTTSGGKQESMQRFCDAFQLLSESVKSRLVVENDDKPKQYTVEDLIFIYERIGIPITFDYFHHSLNPGNLTEEQALKLAATTWPKGITQAVHYSESKRLHENNDKENARAHSDYIHKLPESYGLDIDVMTECKMKELAILPYMKTNNPALSKTIFANS
jgi:UV DNA damage endonuclease